ncbi:MAG: 30S ribosomal protein S19 [Candidatus Diapherotrites archaeon]|nr:30S ribosomal protein S19 [Candidatus Diapherotrites archaeon]
MAKKEIIYWGKTLSELQNMPDEEFLKVLPARSRRTIARGYTDRQKVTIDKIRAAAQALMSEQKPKEIRTHCRDMIFLPFMVGVTIKIHNGKTFTPITILPEMIGHFFGETVLTRKRLKHGSMGVGATGSTKHIAAK